MEKIKYKGQVYMRCDANKEEGMAMVAKLLKNSASSCSTAAATLRATTGKTRIHAPSADTDIEKLAKLLKECAELAEKQIKNGVYK